MLLDNVSDDFDWYNRDPEGYMAEQNRRDEIVNKKLAEFLGDEFKKFPLYTAEEVKHEIENRSGRLAALRSLKAPQILLDNEQRMLEEALDVLQKGKYAVTQAELEYRERYWKKHEEFFNQDHQWDWETVGK